LGKALVFRQRGNPEQAMNFPRRPLRITMGLPHFSQFTPAGSAGALGLVAKRMPSGNGLVFSHWG